MRSGRERGNEQKFEKAVATRPLPERPRRGVSKVCTTSDLEPPNVWPE